MSGQYRRLLQLGARWPQDLTKGDRDLGKFIRECVKEAFEGEGKTTLDSEYCKRQYAALARLADNAHRNKHKRTTQSTATGLTTDECNIVLSSEFLDYLQEDNKSIVRKLLDKTSGKK